MATVTQKTKAWITEHSGIRPEDLANPEPALVESLAFSNNNMANMGWTLAGDATITVELVDTKTLVDNKIDSLRAELKKADADHEALRTKINRDINTLLAITFDQPKEAL